MDRVDIKSLEKEFKLNNYWGIMTSVDIQNCDYDKITNRNIINAFVIELCNLIEMKRYGKAQIVNFGEDDNIAGYSLFQFIETSSITGHFVNKTSGVYLDVFSCKLYDVSKVLHFTQLFFNGTIKKYQIILR
ncbi:MAG: S-adenosylmethionine decarboxylase [Bacteroidales bacterium]|nr:S-adenosylmethionine decarboxylase [Bacteroidales bacterium]